MHTEYLQSTRHKLQKKVRRLKSAGFLTYISCLRQFWCFFDESPILVAIQEELRARSPQAESIAEQIVAAGLSEVDKKGKGALRSALDSEQTWAAVSLGVLRRFALVHDYQLVTKMILPQSSTRYDDHFAAFSGFYLDPFYDCVDERLDDPRFILGQLVRFKHLSEWFWRGAMYERWEAAKSLGEKALALRLYEFLFSEGIHIQIEPSSVSGEADMVGSQVGEDRLVADAKIFNPDKGKGAKYLVQGFRQIYQYTCDYNEPIGYLVIFNTSDVQLRFAVPAAAEPLPRLVVNHKTIYFLVIDLYPHETSASKRPQPRVVEITGAEIAGT
jgi:hypothetical protein